MTLKEIAKDPLAQVTAGLGGIAAALRPEILLGVADGLFVSAPQLFTSVTVTGLTLPQVFPPDSTTDWVVVVAGIILIGYLGRQILQNIDKEVS
ncbi:hypothetical protein [Halorubrum salinum]|uniref:hypothetical protein n=1 Tax=Halorubrum salinum TaxID=767517 RepID=UPI0021116F09|nr:hypothetical protein [Halorubrum salinum]